MSQLEAIAVVTGYYNGCCVVRPTDPAAVLPTGMALSPLEDLRRLHAANGDLQSHFDALKADYDALLSNVIALRAFAREVMASNQAPLYIAERYGLIEYVGGDGWTDTPILTGE